MDMSSLLGPPLIPAQHTGGADEVAKLRRELTRTGNAIWAVARVALLFAVFAAAVIGYILFASSAMDPDRKVGYAGGLGVIMVGLIAGLLTTRDDHIAQLWLTALCLPMSGIALGLSVFYL